MRKLILSLFVINNAYALNLGGVDVGNGHSVLTGFQTRGFKSEVELQYYGEEAMFPILEGTHPTVLELAMKGKCSMDGIQIRGLSVEKYFPIDLENKYYQRRFRGEYVIQLNNCLKPENLEKPENWK